MKLFDVFRIAFRMLWVNRSRSLLTAFGFAVAISFMVVLTGLGYGLQNLTIGSIVESEALLSLDISAPSETSLVVNAALVERVQALKLTQSVSPVVVTSGQLAYNNKRAAMGVTAANQEYLAMQGVRVTNGRAYTMDQAEIIIAPTILALLDLPEESAVGTVVEFRYDDPTQSTDTKLVGPVTIVGVAGKDESPSAYIPLSLLGNPAIPYTSLKALGQHRDAVVQLRSTLISQGYQVDSLIDTLDQARTVFQWVTIGLTIFGSIALVVASIGMFNTLTITLLERTREIGIMKAIGVTDRTVLLLFLAEAATFGFVGGFLGIVLGITAGNGVEALFNEFGKVYNNNTKLILFAYPAGFLVAMVVFSVLLSILTGLYPARRAARLNPLVALRYE